MRGNFARVTFEPLKHFTQVLQNQGRVHLEADWNEQGAIMLHLLRSVISDIAGRAWRAGTGFTLSWDPDTLALKISKGHCYVDGVLCENEQDTTYATQPFLPVPAEDVAPVAKEFGLLYIDAWERHVTAIEAPELREIALGGPETTSRAQVVWQVRSLDPDRMTARAKLTDTALSRRLEWAQDIDDKPLIAALEAARKVLQDLGPLIGTKDFLCPEAKQLLESDVECAPMMRARAKPADTQNDVCAISPESRYRGLENQLYRVEVHDAGIGDGKTATFKWSRENGSVCFPIVGIEDNNGKAVVRLAALGRDSRLDLCSGDWIEFVDDDIVFAQRARPLAKVLDVDRAWSTVRVSIGAPDINLNRHPLLRRWDQQERLNANGVIPITESAQKDSGWLPIEDGVSVQFQPGGLYATGDYWLVAARVESGDVEWPSDPDDSTVKHWKRPSGITHHVASLAVLKKATTLNATFGICMNSLEPLVK